jgi:hypothetical protein
VKFGRNLFLLKGSNFLMFVSILRTKIPTFSANTFGQFSGIIELDAVVKYFYDGIRCRAVISVNNHINYNFDDTGHLIVILACGRHWAICCYLLPPPPHDCHEVIPSGYHVAL